MTFYRLYLYQVGDAVATPDDEELTTVEGLARRLQDLATNGVIVKRTLVNVRKITKIGDNVIDNKLVATFSDL